MHGTSIVQLACVFSSSLSLRKPLKKTIESLTAVKPEGGGFDGLVVIPLRFFFHAQNLFVWLKKCQKHILCSLLTQDITYFENYLTV